MRIAYIVNPVAGSGRAWAVWRRLVAKHPEIERDAMITQGPADAERIVPAAVEKGYDAVVAVGGDGTLHEVLNGALGSPRVPSIGVIPAGTGNDFSRSVGLPRDPEQAYRTCLLGRAEPIDVGLVNGRAFINVAGFGFDAAVAHEVAQRSNRGATGAIPYLLAVFNQLRHFRPRELRLEVDGHVRSGRLLMGAVGNGSTYGGGMKICPHARVDDGTLDLFIGGDFGPFETLVNLVRVFMGSHITHPKCHYQKAWKIVVDGDPSVRVHADGQLLGSLPVTFEVRPRAVRFLMSPDFQPSPQIDGPPHHGSSGSTPSRASSASTDST